MTEHNFNDRVKVRITPEGEKLWNLWFERLSLLPRAIERDADGYSEMQLWEVANIFGDGMYNGCTPPVEMTFFIADQHSASPAV